MSPSVVTEVYIHNCGDTNIDIIHIDGKHPGYFIK